MNKKIISVVGIALFGCAHLCSQSKEKIWRIPSVKIAGGAASIVVQNENDGLLQISVEAPKGKRLLYSDSEVEGIVGVARFYGFLQVTYSRRTGPPCASDLYTVLLDEKSTRAYPALKMKLRVGCDANSRCFLDEVVKDGLKIKELNLVASGGGKKTLHWDAANEVFYTVRAKSGAFQIKLPGQTWLFSEGRWSE